MRIEERVYISDESDAGTHGDGPRPRGSIPARPRGCRPSSPGGGTAVDVAEPIEAITLIEEEIRESYLEIIDRVDRSVVTVIEVLSPTNKVAGSRGRESYERKRKEVMNSPSHWSRSTSCAAECSIPVYGRFRRHEYLVHVSPRATRVPTALLWPIRLSQRLPAIRDSPQARGRERRARPPGCSRHGLRSRGLRPGDRLSGRSCSAARGRVEAWAHRLLQEKGLRRTEAGPRPGPTHRPRGTSLWIRPSKARM